MFARKGTGAPWLERGGLVSRILLQEGDVPGVGLTATRVEVVPGSRQRLHDHVAEQVYVRSSGAGEGAGRRGGAAGGGRGLVYVPPGALHGIENASEGALVYVSAATPALNAEAA